MVAIVVLVGGGGEVDEAADQVGEGLARWGTSRSN